MEFDNGKKPAETGDNKETKKKRSRKRTPAHVPLPINEKSEQPQQKESNTAKYDSKKPKKVHTEKTHEVDTVDTSTSTEHTAKESHQSVALDSREHIAVEHTPKTKEQADTTVEAGEDSVVLDEAEVPLHAATEGEVFVSERLQPLSETTDETTDQSNTEDQTETRAELVEPVDDSDKATEEKSSSQASAGNSTGARFRQNPQQQQQTKSTSKQAAASTSAAASSPFLSQWRNRNARGTSPNTPDTPPIYANQPPSPNNPNIQTLSPDVAPITSTSVSEQVRDRFSERRHLVTGLVVGALVEHVRHKRREKRMEKAHKKETNELKKAQQGEQIQRQAEQNKQLREKTALEKTIERLEKKVVVSKESKNPKPQAEALTAPASQQETAIKTAEEAKKEFEERARRAVAIAREPAEELEVPKEHRIENSSWHAIEVDKKTGKAVENQSFAYGEAFHQEQHQEQLRKDTTSKADTKKADKKTSNHDTSSLSVPTYEQNSYEQSKSEKLREKAVDAAQAGVQLASKVHPIDALLWVILGIVVLVILKLL